jgi:hypothetical protein
MYFSFFEFSAIRQRDIEEIEVDVLVRLPVLHHAAIIDVGTAEPNECSR